MNIVINASRLSTRLQNILKRNNIIYHDDLVQHTKASLRSLHGLGYKTFHELIDYINNHGLCLKPKSRHHFFSNERLTRQRPVAVFNADGILLHGFATITSANRRHATIMKSIKYNKPLSDGTYWSDVETDSYFAY